MTDNDVKMTDADAKDTRSKRKTVDAPDGEGAAKKDGAPLIIDFSDEKKRKSTFPDLVITSKTGKKFYFYRVYLCAERCKAIVLTAALGGETADRNSEISIDAGDDEINALLNWLWLDQSDFRKRSALLNELVYTPSVLVNLWALAHKYDEQSLLDEAYQKILWEDCFSRMRLAERIAFYDLHISFKMDTTLLIITLLEFLETRDWGRVESHVILTEHIRWFSNAIVSQIWNKVNLFNRAPAVAIALFVGKHDDPDSPGCIAAIKQKCSEMHVTCESFRHAVNICNVLKLPTHQLLLAAFDQLAVSRIGFIDSGIIFR